jgi:hypothetical protein
MIKITVDEAYAFDYYTILELKKENGSQIDHIINTIKSDLIEYIGLEKFNLIIESEEYLKLYSSNKKTFEAVDKAKTDEVLASYVDKCNYLRMIHKRELQNKFFSNSLSEIKLGYEKLSLKNE